jgi:FkbM family methyltransferase
MKTTPPTNRRNRGHKSLFQRVTGRIARLFVGDRVLLPRRMADTRWHLGTVRHRIRGGRIVVRFDNLDADITVDARSDLALRAIGEGSYEKEMLDVLPSLAGSGDVVNIGANVGIVAIALCRVAAEGRRVLCVEPIPECVELLKANLANAGLTERTIVLQAFAAAAADGAREMWTVPGKPEYSSGGRIVHQAVATDRKVSQMVPTIRIDEAVSGSDLVPSAIVMDCEGGEFNALRGATTTLSAQRPTIVLEFDPPLLAANGCSSQEFLRFFAGLGYGCVALSANAADIGPDFSGTAVAAPTERLAAVRRALVETLSRA